MSSPIVLYLVRHGRTVLNADGRLRGRLDPPLDDEGVAEAEALGRTFARMEVATIVSSPLARARQTAEHIAAACGLPVDVDDRLADRDYKEWAGTRPDELGRRFGSVDAAPGVEPLEALSARATAAVDAIAALAARRKGRAAVFVAHDAVNRAILAALVPSLGTPARISQRTGCWNRLELDDGRWSAPVVDAVPARH